MRKTAGETNLSTIRSGGSCGENREKERFSGLGKTQGWEVGMLGVQRLDGQETK